MRLTRLVVSSVLLAVSMASAQWLALCVISLETASGMEPAEEVNVTMRRISTSEVMDILHKFPEMVPSYFVSEKDNVGLLTQLFRFSEVTAAPLERAFPAVRFYQGLDGKKPPHPYLMAVVGDKREMMPGGFNRLLIDNGLNVTDENIIELAKAFVVLAIGSEPITNRETGEPDGLDSFPQVTFLEAKRIKELISGISYDAKLKVRVGERVEEWYFDSEYDNLRSVSRGNAKGLIRQYLLNTVELPRKRGQLDLTPSIDIDTASNDAYALGTKPADGVNVSLRRISASEVMGILNQFPEMVPSYLAEQRNDTGLLKYLFPFKEATSAPMERVFPGVRFYQGLDRSRTDVEYPYMIAIAGDKRYAMPNGFNRLLVDNGQKVTDKNMVELAEAFVIFAICSEHYYSFPEITFLGATRTKQVINTVSYNARLKVKMGGQTEDWHFAVLQGQIDIVNRRSATGLIKEYHPVPVESLPSRGQLTPTPGAPEQQE